MKALYYTWYGTDYAPVLSRAYDELFIENGSPVDLTPYIHTFILGKEAKVNYNITYYKDDNGKVGEKLNGAPSTAGKYHAKAELKTSSSQWGMPVEKVELDGTEYTLPLARTWVEFSILTKDDVKDLLEQTKEELNSTQAELDAKREEADGVIAELVAKGQEIEGLQDELESEDQDLLKQIAQMEKEYNAAKHQEWLAYMATYTTVPPATTAAASGSGSSTGTSTPSSGGNWLRPCSYTYMSSPFGFRTSPTAGASSYHQGVDLAAPANTPVYASRSGIVTTTTYSGSAGYYVTINHGDGFSSIYMHLNNYVVSAGQAVSAGQLIGYVGATGAATGSHCHFEMYYNNALISARNVFPDI